MPIDARAKYAHLSSRSSRSIRAQVEQVHVWSDHAIRNMWPSVKFDSPETRLAFGFPREIRENFAAQIFDCLGLSFQHVQYTRAKRPATGTPYLWVGRFSAGHRESASRDVYGNPGPDPLVKSMELLAYLWGTRCPVPNRFSRASFK